MYHWQLSDKATRHRPSTLSSVITDGSVKDKQKGKKGGAQGSGFARVMNREAETPNLYEKTHV